MGTWVTYPCSNFEIGRLLKLRWTENDGWPNSLSWFTDEETEGKVIKWQHKHSQSREHGLLTTTLGHLQPVTLVEEQLSNLWVLYILYMATAWKLLVQWKQPHCIGSGTPGPGLDLSPGNRCVELSAFCTWHILETDQIIKISQQLVKLHKAIRKLVYY